MMFICVVQGFPEFVFKWYIDAGIVWLFYWYIYCELSADHYAMILSTIITVPSLIFLSVVCKGTVIDRWVSWVEHSSSSGHVYSVSGYDNVLLSSVSGWKKDLLITMLL